MTKTITGAELKTRLGGLGLPPSWFADLMGVTMRTVVRWFDGGMVSPEVSVELEKLSDATIAEMQKMVAKVGDTDGVTLRTYRTDDEYISGDGWPASWHRALTFRVLDHLRAQGRTVNIEYK